MLDDYEKLCIESDSQGNFEAWKNYVSKYEVLFSGILKGLYMLDLEDLKPIIERVNFKDIYIKAKKNEEKGCIEEIIKLAEKGLNYFGSKNELTLYIGCEIDNVGACVLPTEEGTIVYFGIETIKNIEGLKFLVLHEINHFIRDLDLNKDNDLKIEQMNSLKERLISEGLGVFTPFNLLELEDNAEDLSKVIGIPAKNIQTLIKQEKLLEKEILEQIDEMLNFDMMRKYFAYTAEDMLADKPLYSGYFIGFRIIQKLHSTKKYSLQELTNLPSDKILEEYLKLYNL